MRNERNDLIDKIEGVNKKIIETQWNFDVQLRKYNDPKLILNEQKKTHAYKQENSQCKLDIDIAESRRADLSAQVDMQNRQIEEILGEKREVEQQNAELEWKISGRGMTEADQKQKLFEAERKMEMELAHKLQIMREDAETMDNQLKEEEKKCKEMLDLLVTAEQQYKDFTKPDAEEKAAKKLDNREAILRAKIKLSQLQSQKKRQTAELEQVTEQNTKVIKQNEDYDKKNAKLDSDILELIQRVDVAALLKQVDLEEMNLLAQNNVNMNKAFASLLNSWQRIEQKEEF